VLVVVDVVVVHQYRVGVVAVDPAGLAGSWLESKTCTALPLKRWNSLWSISTSPPPVMLASGRPFTTGSAAVLARV
jgi:hypothetical protein